ncbi:unnamed protein product [Gemmata massiliana]|uniref:Uncharacterized protein n=1 Tax=Gemmata massiliana TaxID=1210884 RepID=A0A6P2CYB7_9BACT|nr:hypothetical protein [Gemmata massiliana]VTR94108.1 unnamed protein product [Gemmata massiliana]
MLQVIDRTVRVAAPAPSAPTLPYRVEMHRYGPGEGVARPTKVYTNGGGELLTPDEIGMWARLCWVRTEIARRKGEAVAAEHDPANPPPLPYEAKPFRYGAGAGVEVLTKTRPGDYSGEGLTPDECAAWAYLQALEEELEALVPPEPSTSNTVLEAEPVSNVGIPVPEDVLEIVADVVASETTIPGRAVPGEEAVAPVTSNASTTLTKREQAERALLESPTLNNCAIGELIGASDELVRRVRKELEAAGRLQPVAVLTKRDGASYVIADAAVGVDPATG